MSYVVESFSLKILKAHTMLLKTKHAHGHTRFAFSELLDETPEFD